MDERVFDAMLKNALEEALFLDAAEEAPPVRQSRRQRRRMKRMLADPAGYYRRWSGGEEEAAPAGLRRRFTRYAAVAVVAALLAGTAAAYTLTGGEFFRRMFDGSGWADMYGDAADTEQLLEMGGGSVGAVVQDETLRLEILDVVSDGQFAMVSVRCTILRQDLLDGRQPGDLRFMDMDITNEAGEHPSSYGMSVSYPETREDLGPGQYGMIFSFSSSGAPLNGRYGIALRDLGVRGEEKTETCASGPWTLEVTLPDTGAQPRRVELPCTVAGEPGVLETISLSPLALYMEFRFPEGLEDAAFDEFGETLICMKDGRTIGNDGYVCGIGGGGGGARVTLEFQMPLDLRQVKSVQVCGLEIPADDLL